MSRRSQVPFGATLALALASVVACASETPPPAPPEACPPGHVRGAAGCVAQRPPVSEASASVASPPPSPAQSVAAGPEAVGLDAAQLGGAEALLTELSRAEFGGARSVGEVVAGQFDEGQSLVAAVRVEPGVCYSVVALGLPPVSRIELAIRSEDVPEFGARVEVAEPPRAVLGKPPKCLELPRAASQPLELVLTVKAGQGVALARIYEAR